jgi:flagellar hook assembly protein FlgD
LSCYPNPFNASTRISYILPNPTRVRLTIFDILGRQITTLADRHQQAGKHVTIWSPESSTNALVSSGMYFVRMETNAGVFSEKMLFIK